MPPSPSTPNKCAPKSPLTLEQSACRLSVVLPAAIVVPPTAPPRADTQPAHCLDYTKSGRAYLSIPGNERPQLPRGLGGEMGGWGLRGRRVVQPHATVR